MCKTNQNKKEMSKYILYTYDYEYKIQVCCFVYESKNVEKKERNRETEWEIGMREKRNNKRTMSEKIKEKWKKKNLENGQTKTYNI